ncbi:MAG: hypothetical protein V4552_03880 [Pseudomonadota bacterium]
MIDWGIILSAAATVITLIGVIVSVRSLKKQLQLSFFSEYTKRYQEIVLNFPESINQSDFHFDKLEKTERDKTLRYMRAYFDLCSEEYFLWKQKNIDEETWKQWETGIKFAFSKAAFRVAWSILRLDTVYYGEFSQFVEKIIPVKNI